jgi:hypothetical protein
LFFEVFWWCFEDLKERIGVGFCGLFFLVLEKVSEGLAGIFD